MLKRRQQQQQEQQQQNWTETSAVTHCREDSFFRGSSPKVLNKETDLRKDKQQQQKNQQKSRGEKIKIQSCQLTCLTINIKVSPSGWNEVKTGDNFYP